MEPDHHVRFSARRISIFNPPVIIVEPNCIFDAIVDQDGRGKLQTPGRKDV